MLEKQLSRISRVWKSSFPSKHNDSLRWTVGGFAICSCHHFTHQHSCFPPISSVLSRQNKVKAMLWTRPTCLKSRVFLILFVCDWIWAAFLMPCLHSLGPSWEELLTLLRKSYSFNRTGNSLLSSTVQANFQHKPSFCFSYAHAAYLLLLEICTWIFPCILTYGWIAKLWHQGQIPKSSPPSQLSLFPLWSSRFLILETEGE